MRINVCARSAADMDKFACTYKYFGRSDFGKAFMSKVNSNGLFRLDSAAAATPRDSPRSIASSTARDGARGKTIIITKGRKSERPAAALPKKGIH